MSMEIGQFVVGVDPCLQRIGWRAPDFPSGWKLDIRAQEAFGTTEDHVSCLFCDHNCCRIALTIDGITVACQNLSSMLIA